MTDVYVKLEDVVERVMEMLKSGVAFDHAELWVELYQVCERIEKEGSE